MFINLPIWIYIPFAIFVILGTTNAVNLTDGVDGLASSISAIIMTFFTVLAMMLDVKEITVFGAIVVGACLGFLLFNLHTAKVMMGDTGSLLLRRNNSICCTLSKNAIGINNSSFNTNNRNFICNVTSKFL